MFAVNGAVAPVLMSSFPPGSLSDMTSKAVSPPPSPSNSRHHDISHSIIHENICGEKKVKRKKNIICWFAEVSPCKESPRSPTVDEIPRKSLEASWLLFQFVPNSLKLLFIFVSTQFGIHLFLSLRACKGLYSAIQGTHGWNLPWYGGRFEPTYSLRRCASD